jgi:hypothetical protein
MSLDEDHPLLSRAGGEKYPVTKANAIAKLLGPWIFPCVAKSKKRAPEEREDGVDNPLDCLSGDSASSLFAD